MKFQYNKTALQDLDKQLKTRVRALPTIKNKEAALRVEVKRAKDEATEIENKLKRKIAEYDKFVRIWGEFDHTLLSVKDLELSIKKVAGVKIPQLENIIFEAREFSLFNNPQWFLAGITILKELTTIALEREVHYRKSELLYLARKKTTQKVNLYEKVQIPGYEDAIRKIKRFLEDEENLSKSSQKIVKNRQQEQEEYA
ncbi:MAG TPA: V-type ATP synthase subunit D [Draconibacterium sp.]|jgi:V/A-type H+/Na+-transporting ATPase subunit D|nr:V-type ATP synthase subunit D [Draconibacterium sp.]